MYTRARSACTCALAATMQTWRAVDCDVLSRAYGTSAKADVRRPVEPAQAVARGGRLRRLRAAVRRNSNLRRTGLWREVAEFEQRQCRGTCRTRR